MSKRSNESISPPEKSDYYHGMARYTSTSPNVKRKDFPSLNVFLKFEEAMKLSLALQSTLFRLNRYNRATKKGKEMGMVLSIKTGYNTITVLETKVTDE
jgi:hypothetical protein